MFSHISHPKTPVEVELDRMLRMGRAWREIRRGSAAGAVRERVFGSDETALDPGQVDTLDLLAAKDCWRMGDLADALHIDPSTATRAVQRLIASGLAEKVTQEGDGRVVHVALTEIGRQTAAYYTERRVETIRELLSNFTNSEQIAFLEFLERYIHNMSEMTQIPIVEIEQEPTQATTVHK
jgi:DNA-binding MarR family transcriptional regulator